MSIFYSSVIRIKWGLDNMIETKKCISCDKVYPISLMFGKYCHLCSTFISRKEIISKAMASLPKHLDKDFEYFQDIVYDRETNKRG